MKRFYLFVAVAACCLLGVKPSYATHNMGKDIQYICHGVVAGQMQYEVIIRYYRNCWDNQSGSAAVNAPSSVSLEVSATNCTGYTANYTAQLDPNAVPPNGSEVSQLCASQLPSSGCNWTQAGNPPYPGVQIYTYRRLVSVPLGCTNVTFGTTDCCRNGAINNIPSPDSRDLSIKATANNTIDPLTGQPYCNNSVTFTNQPVPFFCLGSGVTFNHGAVDSDGDSLVYSLINPLEGGSLPYTNIPFMANYNVSTPIRTSPANTFNFNTQTGQMQFTPAFQEQCVLAVRVDEYRNGILIGSTMRDIQVVILNCAIAIPAQEPITNVQNGNQVDSLSVQVCPGTPLRFDILCTDPANHDLVLSSNLNTTPSAIPGATMTQVGTGDTVTARIEWTPLPGDTGCHNFVLTAENDDCPIKGTYTRVYSICVFTKVQLLSASIAYCGTPVQLTATGGTNFVWTPSTGPNAVSNPNIYNPTVTPAASTMYYFSSDCGTDSVFVAAAPPFTYDAGPGGSICQNGQVQLNATVDNLYAPYHFQWVPSAGLYDPISNTPNDTVPNPVASPTGTTKYYLRVTGSNGCTNVDSVTVNVAGTGPNIIAKAVPTNICPGDEVNLNILTSPQSCGIAQTPCQGTQVQAQIGTGTTAYPTGSPTNYPTIYGHYANSARHQFLYLSNEVLAITGAGGTIDSISFYMVAINSTPDTMKNFEIKMGCTQATSLTNWQPNLSTVFTPKNVPLGITSGWITHALDFPYDWDGSSNLVIDVCSYNPPGGPAMLNKKMQGTPTAFPSVYYSKGSTSQCGNTGMPSSSVNRPNALFSMCQTDVSGLPIAWTPSTGLNAPIPPDSISPVAYPVSPVRYEVDVTSPNGCHSQDFVYVNVDTSIRLNAYPADTFLCNPGPVQLTTATQGSPLPGNSFTYQWTNLTTNTAAGTGPSISANHSTNTDYLITLTGGACTLYDTVHLRYGSSIPVNMVIDSISCFGNNDGGITAQPLGGNGTISYSWSNNVQNTNVISNLSPGIYSVTISDAQNCTGTASTTLTQPAQLSYSANFTNVTCFGANDGIIAITPSGGTPNYNYQWSPTQPNAGTATGLPAGNYAITVTDANNCSLSLSSAISEPAAINLSLAQTNASCDASLDGTATATVSGGTGAYTYQWDAVNGNNTINNLDNGTHTIVVLDANNCSVTQSFVIDTIYELHITATATNVSCFGATDGTATVTTLNGTPGYTYLWNPTGQNMATATLLTAGNYTVLVTDSKNCTATANALIDGPTEIVLQLTHTDPLCTGIADGTAGVTATGGAGNYTYDWDVVPGTADNSSITGLPAGTYNVVVTDADNCNATGNVTLTNPPSLDAVVQNKNEITCANAMDGSVEISVAGGTPPVSFSWSNGATANAISNLGPGTYTVQVSDLNGCDTTLSIVFNAPPLIEVASLLVDSVSCPGYTDARVQVNGMGGTPGAIAPYQYSIDGVNYYANGTFIDLPTGNYTLTIRDAQGCTKDTTIAVYEPAIPVLNILPGDSSIELGESITLTAQLSTYPAADINFYTWQPTTALNCTDCSTVLATPYSNIQYTVTVSYLQGCTVSQTVNVLVGNGKDFFVPNAFSPNGDGNNDVFKVYGIGLTKTSLKIFNRWGEKVLDTQNQWEGWDGNYKGQAAPAGVYTYYVEGIYLNGEVRSQKGTVTLIR